jgi:SH3-like domain-containing protein
VEVAVNLKNYRIRFAKDGRHVAKIIGVDMQAKMPIVAQHGEYIVFKRNGFTGWVSRGETGYYPPVYYLIRERDGTIVEALDEIEAERGTWREVRDALVNKAQTLASAAAIC